VQDGWSWFDLVVKLREILNTLLGAQATNADTFTAFRKQVAKVFRFVKANTVAPPTQASSSLPATIGTSSAVLNASDISMGDAPDDIATTPALDKGKSKTVDSPAPVQNTLAIFAGDSTKFSSHAMIEEIMGWLNGDAIPAGPGDGPAPGPPAPPAPPSGSGGSSSNPSASPSGSLPPGSGGAPSGGATGPSSPADTPSNTPVTDAATSSSHSSLTSTLDKGKGKVVSQTAPPQSLASFDITTLTKLDDLSFALKNPVFLGELAFECVSVTGMVTKQ
jgi:hypothetical protein